MALKRRILLVDDEIPLLFAVKHYLREKGLEIECAQELEEAQALLSNFEFDIVVTDIRLGALQGAEGLYVIEFLRQRHRSTPVIVLTAHGSGAVAQEARRLGAAAVLYKPVALADLAATIDSLCSEAR